MTSCPPILALFLLLAAALPGASAEPKGSAATQECLECHRAVHPGIVADWEASRHAARTPTEALAVQRPARRLSAATVPAELAGAVVGCAECHTQRPEAHADTFEHNGHRVHLVVSPEDCRTCHAEEAAQYSGNIMAHAYGNLAGNRAYQALEQSILGLPVRGGGRTAYKPAGPETRAEACYHCHGTRLRKAGTELRDTALAGELEFPKIEGWPNQGVGRVNLDGSLGSCSACHTRHRFAIETARKPHTCKQCHVGPDVPAAKVYEASKHGALFATHQAEWDFQAVPWAVGRDFGAPTCAACHVSGIVDSEGEAVARRTHQMNDRLPWRIFGLIYAHPHPREPDTTVIRNRRGQPLPTDLDGGMAAAFLIETAEMDRRRNAMQALCLKCHGTSWVAGQWSRLESAIAETNAKTLAATRIMQAAWRAGLAAGLDRGANPFDEAVERRWADTWLIYANTIRFASAMGCGGDYGVFADGRYELNRAIAELDEWLELRRRLGQAAP